MNKTISNNGRERLATDKTDEIAKLNKEFPLIPHTGVTRTLHNLFEGYLTDAPGRCESWIEYVRYLGNSRWSLVVEGTDFSGVHSSEKHSERMSTTKLIDWVLERDAEDRSDEEQTDMNDAQGGEPQRELGPRGVRLLEIAALERADLCVRRLQQWKERSWPKGPKAPRTLAITGVGKRWRWTHIWDPVYVVNTTLGLAFLCPPAADGAAIILLKSAASRFPSKGWAIRLPRSTLAVLKSFKPALAQLEREKQSQEQDENPMQLVGDRLERGLKEMFGPFTETPPQEHKQRQQEQSESEQSPMQPLGYRLEQALLDMVAAGSNPTGEVSEKEPPSKEEYLRADANATELPDPMQPAADSIEEWLEEQFPSADPTDRLEGMQGAADRVEQALREKLAESHPTEDEANVIEEFNDWVN